MATRSNAYVEWVETCLTYNICGQSHPRYTHLSEKGTRNYIVDTYLPCRLIDSQLVSKLKEVFQDHTAEHTRIFILKRLKTKIADWGTGVRGRCADVDAEQNVIDICTKRSEAHLEELNVSFLHKQLAAKRALSKRTKLRATKSRALHEKAAEEGTRDIRATKNPEHPSGRPTSAQIAKPVSRSHETMGATTENSHEQLRQEQNPRPAPDMGELESHVLTLQVSNAMRPLPKMRKRKEPPTEGTAAPQHQPNEAPEDVRPSLLTGTQLDLHIRQEHPPSPSNAVLPGMSQEAYVTKKARRDFAAGLDALEQEEDNSRPNLRRSVEKWRRILHV